MDSIRPLKNYDGGIVPQAVLNGTLGTVVYASNYNDLDNKPSINSVELRGNKTAEELGLATPSDITVTSVNNQTGEVSLTGQNIPYDNDLSVSEKINDLESQITGSGVTSVNGKTGVVNLTGTDINYSAGVSLNAKIDAVEGEIPVVDYPVTSVNNKTGAVELTGSDIEYSAGVSINTQLDDVAGDLAGLTAEDIPMSGTDSTPTATAIGDLSALTTSVTSSLVGAVNEIARYTPVYGNTASGSIATFDTSLALPLQDCTIEINAVQESGTPTPSSPKAISGFTGANVTRCGKNRLNVADKTTTYSSYIIDNEYVPMVVGYYILSFDFSGTSNSSSLRVDDENGTAVFTTTKIITSGHNEFLINLPSKGAFVKLYSNAVGTYSKFQIEQGNQFTNYEDYNGNTYEFEFGQTVYGGSLDVTRGKLVSKYARIKISDMNWNKGSDFFHSSLPLKKKGVTNILCECLRVVDVSSVSEMVNGDIKGYPDNTNIYIKNTDWASATDLYNAIGDYYIVYELATPITYQLTPTQISAIVGTNNVFMDTNGNTSVVYACSLKDYIDGQ